MELFYRIRQVIRANFNEMIQQEKNPETVGLTFYSREGLQGYQTITEVARIQRDGQQETVETINHSLVTLEKKQAAVNNLEYRLYDSTHFSQFPLYEDQETINIPDNVPQFQESAWKEIEGLFISLTSSSEMDNEWATLEEFASKISI
ncbi:hypothetical protein MC7420_4293 [Coleofasciculus chthonoplastes PCC 7420]|uniref:Uncharacterized protein n=1 Tax=Coleofasciculus chthonoplastes PCC 7420 TaxID=118168 RepID=B4W3Z6_9CYAN|nr:hypothetical protein [Coleofasciculus chthonoplastes]EDX71106.1 hypothetical protein MC7420_4293 [Coleofasciculus chthonoplastes PCC 7420]